MKPIINRLITGITLFVSCFIIASCGSTKEEQLIERGKEYISRHISSPTFVSTTPIDRTEALLKEWGVNLEDKHDALMIGFEATNLYGGRVHKNWCIFFVNGYPIDHADGDNINRVNVHHYISIMREKGW